MMPKVHFRLTSVAQKRLCLRWLDWIFFLGGGYLPSLSINYVAMSKDMEKRLPQQYYRKMKISYDLVLSQSVSPWQRNDAIHHHHHHHHHRSAAEQATTSFLQPQRSCANSDKLPGPIMLSVSPKRC